MDFFNDLHPYVLIYLLGSLLVILLIFVKVALFHIIDWIIKANILKKNLKKLAKPDNTAWYFRVLKFLGVLLFEALLSWINVAIVLGQILYGIVKILRDVFTPAPEEIKALRFPLRNNPNLSTGAVWAYLMALNVKIGVPLKNKYGIVESIEEVLDNRPDFDYQDALDQLASLKVIDLEIIASVKNSFVPKDDDFDNYNEFIFSPAEDKDDGHAEMRLYPDLNQYTIYSRTPDYHGQYTSQYEYKIEGTNIYSKVIESKTDYLTDITYEIKDNVVLENEVRQKMLEEGLFDQEYIDERIEGLREEVEWQEIPSRFKYFIMLRHRDVFNDTELKKYYRSELQRIRGGNTALEQEVKKLGGVIGPFDEDDNINYRCLRSGKDLPDDKVAMLSDIRSNPEQFNISYYEFENLDKISEELSQYLNKLN